MKIRFFTFTYLIIILLLFSCSNIIFKFLGVDAKNVNLKTITSNNKEIVFFPMHHIGKKEFYEDVYRKTDSLGILGYKAYYESVSPNIKDSLLLDLLRRKLRKTLGFHLSKRGYIDTLNNTFLGKYKVNKEYINQPHSIKMISLQAAPIKVDIPVDSLIKKFEIEEGMIELDSCDLNTPLDKPYTDCQSLKDIDRDKYKRFNKEYIAKIRNQNLANFIHNSKDSKIIVVYGRKHFKGLLKELRKIDSSWKKE